MNIEKTDYFNLLPYQGKVYLFENFIDSELSFSFYNKLLNEPTWKHDELVIFGKKITTKRKVAFQGNHGITYKYSNKLKISSDWTYSVTELKSMVELFLQKSFNACLLNLYQTGKETMGWHSDNEPELDPNGVIASISFGTTRTFELKHIKYEEKISIPLKDGSLLIMDMETQQNWLHQIKKEQKNTEARINLTFRQFKINE